VIEWDGQTPFPPVAPAGKARMVYETVENCLAVSINGSAYQCLIFGNQVGGGGIVAAGVDDLPTAAGTYRLAPWNEAITAAAPVFEWAAPADGTLRNFFVHHNVLGAAAEDITYEWYINGAASGLQVVLAANASTGSDLVNSVDVDQGDLVELRAVHGGLTSSPQRIVGTAVFGVGRFGDDYLRVDSPAMFCTGAGVDPPTAFVTKPGAVLVTPILTGRYRVRFQVISNTSSANVQTEVRLRNVTDGVDVGDTQVFEPTSSSLEKEDMSAAELVTFTGASKQFELQLRKLDGPKPGSVCVRFAAIEIWRVPSP
jgi:hypothetical protein